MKFRENACALEGMPHPLDVTEKLRVEPALILEPLVRVSATLHGVAGMKFKAPGLPAGAKYPFTSMITSVVLLTATAMDPLTVPTMAASATTVPLGDVRTVELAWPCPPAEREPSAPCGTAVMFKAYAWADPGMPHELEEIGKLRLEPPFMIGGPKEPENP